MNPRALVLCAAILLSVTATLPAQVSLRTAGREFVDAASDVIYTGTAPFRGTKSDWLGAALLAGGFLLLLPVDDNVDSWLSRHQNSAPLRLVRPFTRSNEFGSRLASDSRILPIAGLTVLAGLIVNNPTLRELGYGCVVSSVVSSAVRSPIYAGVSRARPVVANGDQLDIDFPGGEWNFHSFFSGHSMNAFGCATFVATRYELGFAEPLLYALAGAMSVARMADRAHWSTDIYTATVAGVAVGRTVARRTLRRVNATPTQTSLLRGFQLSPTPDGVSIGWRSTF